MTGVPLTSLAFMAALKTSNLDWRGAGAAVVAGDLDHLGLRRGHPGGHGAHPGLSDQLHGNEGALVGAFQVADELGEVLNGVDVVVVGGEKKLRVGGFCGSLGRRDKTVGTSLSFILSGFFKTLVAFCIVMV